MHTPFNALSVSYFISYSRCAYADSLLEEKTSLQRCRGCKQPDAYKPSLSVSNGHCCETTELLSSTTRINKKARLDQVHATGNRWTATHGFYAVMGGFAVDTSSFWKKEQTTFTPAGIVKLAELGLLPAMSEKDIQDKSKANSFAKVLVCWQAGWFLIQFAARLAKGLPVTLLELHTVAQAIFAFAAYAVWFKKPYNVKRPTICDDPRVIDLASLFLLADNHVARKMNIRFSTKRRPPPSRTTLACSMADEFSPLNISPSGKLGQKQSQRLERANRALHRMRSMSQHLTWRVTEIEKCIFFETEYTTDWQADFYVRSPYDKAGIDVRDHSKHGSSSFWSFKKDIAISSLISCLYAAFHLGAWASHFPSIQEQWLWRASALLLVTTPVPWLIRLFSDKDPVESAIEGSSTKSLRRLRNCCLWLGLTIGVCMIILYPAARLYLLVESLISLRSLESGAFQTVAWTKSIPHIS